jgi:hypothetical protein
MGISYTQVSQILIGVYLFLYGLEWTLLTKNSSLKFFFDKKAMFLRLQDRSFLKMVVKVKWIEKLLGFDKFAMGFATIISLFGLILIVLSVANAINGFFLVVAFLSYLFFNSFIAFGFEGADQMAAIVLFCLLIKNLIPTAEYIAEIFLIVQLILSYVVSGIAKLASRHWRDGSAIVMILSTNSFGIGKLNWLTQNKSLAKFICLSVILFEISWVVLPLNSYVAVTFVTLGMLFHLANAYLMGLNLFVWSFAAAYPLVLNSIINFQNKMV